QSHKCLHLPNLTLTLPPWAIRTPGAGDCSRPTPLPLTSSSIPADCASSNAERNALPRKSGTTTPPPTSSTTVPLGGGAAVATRAGPGWEDFAATEGAGLAGASDGVAASIVVLAFSAPSRGCGVLDGAMGEAAPGASSAI